MPSRATVPPLFPSNQLTVIIRDEGPFVHMQQPPVLRSVRITLTPEQVQQLALYYCHGVGKDLFHEVVSHCFIEP